MLFAISIDMACFDSMTVIFFWMFTPRGIFFMGEAKRRGTREQRTKDKQGRVSDSLEAAKLELGIPAEARFLGYAVHLVDADEFLAQLEITSEAIWRVWARRPEDALVFSALEACDKARKQCRSAVSAALFETEEQFFTGIVRAESD
ncbi:MAG: hypothetical protein FHP92_14705 [Denitromonas halophila]|nr:MAG: hypothetical protein FHP92_14705 [Denitromonas halophila]